MKILKVIALILSILALLLSVCACGGSKADLPQNESESTTITDKETENTDETPTATLTTTPKDLLSEIIGEGNDISIADIKFDEARLQESATLPNFCGKSFKTKNLDMGDGSYLNVAKNATLEQYSDYLYSLFEAGFSYYTSNKIGDNFYTTFATKNQIVNAFYLKADKEVRVVVDDRSIFSLPGLKEENVYEALGQNSLTVVAIAETGWPGGMGYVYELSDGSFFIIDGGYYNGGNISSAEWLTKTLQKMASDPKNIRIAAWYISHPHEDHMGAYCDMANKLECRKTITIEKMIINVPAEKHVNSANCKAVVGWLNNALKKWPPKQMIKAHPGQQFFVADLTLTIYSSPDLVLPQLVTITDLNDLCTVATVDYMGKRALFMGDSDTIPNPIIARNYTTSLQADIIQLSHHGYGDTGAGVVYEYVDPTIVFWPVCSAHYDDGSGGGVRFIGFNQKFFAEGITNHIAGELNMTITNFDTWEPEERWNPKSN